VKRRTLPRYRLRKTLKRIKKERMKPAEALSSIVPEQAVAYFSYLLAENLEGTKY
jgi:hypothetical protein